MSFDILVNSGKKEKRVGFVQNGDLVELYVEKNNDQRLVGSIFNGLVEKVIPGMQAAFVNIALERNGFLHIADIVDSRDAYENILEESVADEDVKKKPVKDSSKKYDIVDYLKEGQPIQVQIVKDAIGKKGVRLTTNISLPGRYLVFLPKENLRGISRKIEDREERQRLKDIIKSFKLPDGTGVIVRTAGIGMPKKYFLRDLRFLLNTWRKIRKEADHITPPGFIHHELDLVFKTLRDAFTENVDSLILDNKDEYHKVMKFVKSVLPALKDKVKLYQGAEPIYHHYGLERDIRRSYDKRVWLKSGGYIVIEQTEALTAIDVNTGRSLGRTNLEDTVFKTNMESAEEIAKQVRLRNIGGIIICDFIDMKLKRNQMKVLQKLRACVKGDRAKINILPISDIGLIEMTRQRTKVSTKKYLYDTCDVCEGTGLIKSSENVTIEISREVRHILANRKLKEIKIFVHPRVATYIMNEEREMFYGFEKQMKGRIYIERDPDFKIDGYKIEY